jgi:aminoglycoside 2''-phosphotransferase
MALDGLQLYLERIREAYPDLTIRSATAIVGHGQNNAVLLVNGDTIFRFPLYPQGITRLEQLVRFLRIVARSVSLSVPNPMYVALDDPVPGRAFVGYPRIPGEPLSRELFEARPNESVRQFLVDQLAAFLKQLHAIPPEQILPDEVRAFDPYSEWEHLYRRIRLKLFSAMRSGARDAVARHFEAFLADPRNRSIRPALVHADFGTSNILFDPVTNQISGVIDFDSAHLGDPAIDFASVSCFGLGRLARGYPDLSKALGRIEFYVGTFALQEALFGVENGDDVAFERGIAAYR